MKNYIVVLTIGERIPIDGDELEKVIQAKMTGALYFARRGMIDGKYIGTIVPDFHRKRGVKYSYDAMKEIEPFANDKPMPDVFEDQRVKISGILGKEMKQLNA